MTSKSEILLAFTAGESPPLGHVWRITAKKSDFYLDTLGETGSAMHVSLHGPRQDFPNHRFHLKIDRRAVRDAQERGHFVEHNIAAKGQPFRGLEVGKNAYQVMRIRWRWHLQREKFRSAAVSGNAPELGEGQIGRKLGVMLHPNSAWDVDVFVAYGEPYWPTALGPETGDPRLGPVRSSSGLWLTAASVHRNEMLHPAPSPLVPRLPERGETPVRLLGGGLGEESEDGMYWFVETITARELLTS